MAVWNKSLKIAQKHKLIGTNRINWLELNTGTSVLNSS